MIHKNPIPQETGHKFITFGEIMLRLTPPNYGKIRVANSFEASYGGSEAITCQPGGGQHVFQRGTEQLAGKKRNPHAAQQRRTLHAGDSLHA